MDDTGMNDLMNKVASSIFEDAQRYRWLREQHDPKDLPIAQVVWKRGSDPHEEWVNLINGPDLDRHIDAAMDEEGQDLGARIQEGGATASTPQP